MKRIGFVYKRGPVRRTAILSDPAAGYLLYGAGTLRRRGWEVSMLVGEDPSWIARRFAGLTRRWTRARLGAAGDFAGVISQWRELCRCDVIIAVGPNTGIPLLVLRRMGCLRRPILFLSIGIPGVGARRNQVRRMGNLIARAAGIVCFGAEETSEMKRHFGNPGLRTRFVPFGFPADAFPSARRGPAEKTHDVVSVGSDRNRDFSILFDYARSHPGRRILVVGSAENLRPAGTPPPNLEVQAGLSLEEVFDRLRQSRVGAIPVHENAYSAGTTFLIHALACGLPIVVSETGAIRNGYGLESLSACRRVPPGDGPAFQEALEELLDLPDERLHQLGGEGRAFAVENLTDRALVECIESMLRELETKEAG